MQKKTKKKDREKSITTAINTSRGVAGLKCLMCQA